MSRHSAKPSPSGFHRFFANIRNARFFSASLAIHLILGILLGGVVLFKATQKEESFVAVGGQDFLAPTDTETESPGDAQTVEEFDENPPIPSEAISPAPTASALTSLASTASFELTGSTPELTATGVLTPRPLGSMGPSGGGSRSSGSSGGGGARMSGSFFGSRPSDGVQGLTGYFYDLKQDTRREPTGMTRDQFDAVVTKFITDWNPRVLDDYFRSKEPLVTTQIFIPNMPAIEGPSAFNMERNVEPRMWVVHYKGKVSPPKSGTYYFVGGGDDILFVRLQGKPVLEASYVLRPGFTKPTAHYNYGFSKIKGGFVRGEPMKLKAGEFYDIEVLIGENPGSLFYSCLLLEKDGESYDKDAAGNPLLPVFRTADLEPPSLKKDQTLPPFAKGGAVWLARAL